jgi:lincosamide nucleotidyltransferase A/C/D/E
MMTASALLELLEILEKAGVSLWLDGGWGVDALLQTRTRPHKDLDVFVLLADVSKLRSALEERGFRIRGGTPPHSFVMANESDLDVDVHAFAFDDDGNGVYRMPSGADWIFAPEAFTGRGVVGSKQVACLSPSAQVLCHAQGYVPVEKDFRDMELLHERFGVELPAQLKRG